MKILWAKQSSLAGSIGSQRWHFTVSGLEWWQWRCRKANRIKIEYEGSNNKLGRVDGEGAEDWTKPWYWTSDMSKWVNGGPFIEIEQSGERHIVDTGRPLYCDFLGLRCLWVMQMEISWGSWMYKTGPWKTHLDWRHWFYIKLARNREKAGLWLILRFQGSGQSQMNILFLI